MTSRVRQSSRRGVIILVTFAACVTAIVGSLAQRGAVPSPLPGRQADGVTRLPNGRRIAPAGHHVQVGDLPLEDVASADGRFLIITAQGWTHPTLTMSVDGEVQVGGLVG